MDKLKPFLKVSSGIILIVGGVFVLTDFAFPDGTANLIQILAAILLAIVQRYKSTP